MGCPVWHMGEAQEEEKSRAGAGDVLGGEAMTVKVGQRAWRRHVWG